MKTTVFPENFDPITLGYLDIIERASGLFNHLIVVVLGSSKKHATFSMEECSTFLHSNTAHPPNVEVAVNRGPTVDFAEKQEAVAVVRGVRSVKDYKCRLDIASVNQYIVPEVETVLSCVSPEFSYMSSSTIRELVKHRQDISVYISKDAMEASANR